MKLLRAHIRNFRLLKDIVFTFSTDPTRNLTVVRAANESGKTTLLIALQWGLFGDEALPGRSSEFRLSPIDISLEQQASANVSVAVDFETTNRFGSHKYRLIRSATETVRKSQFTRGRTNLSLFKLTASGGDQLDYPEAHIRPHLPGELREVFFTDGDRALSFIEGSRGDQMKRVRRAIRMLLGLNVIEKAIGHTHTVRANLNKKVRSSAGKQQQLQRASDQLVKLQDQIPKLEERLGVAKRTRENLESYWKSSDRALSDALRKGDRDELARERQRTIDDRKAAERDVVQSAHDQSRLFRSPLIAKHLLVQQFRQAKQRLDKLHMQGKIPSQTIPVLEDQLKQSTCICGTTLDRNDPAGNARRAHIRNLIVESRNSDATQKRLTALYYSAQDLLSPITGRTWTDEYSQVFARRQRANTLKHRLGEKQTVIEERIRELPDVDIQQLRRARDRYRYQLDQAQRKEFDLMSRLSAMKKDFRLVQKTTNTLLQQDQKGMMLASELEVAKDLYRVLSDALETMKTTELERVSECMNQLFLEMIGADVSQRSIINRASITKDFRIIVLGRHNYPLDPSQDLNGASRRALTIAFILALTRVSQVEAPNVIDTPLGMMSGYVKQAVLQRASQQSSQLILFLTPSEIAGCEDILDRYAGRVYTFTNPAHYPKILVNDPNTSEARVLLCGCNHRERCQVCERRENVTLDE